MALNCNSTGYRAFINSVKNDQPSEVEQHLGTHPEFLDLPDGLGMTPLHNAAAWGYLPIVKVLIEHGANVQARDADGKTPLDLARTYKRKAVVSFLEGETKMGDEDLGMSDLKIEEKK